MRLLLVDDQVLFVESLARVLKALDETIDVVGIAYDGAQALRLLENVETDVVLLDVRMPVMGGVQAAGEIHSRFSSVQIIMLTTYGDDDYVHSALRNGAVGYLLKDMPPDQLLDCVRKVYSGAFLISPAILSKLTTAVPAGLGATSALVPPSDVRVPEWFNQLTSREREILRYVALGMKNREIADAMFIAEQTVRNHISIIYSKIGVHDRIRLMDQARGLGRSI